MTTKSLKIEGMTCSACAKAVERSSKKLDGVIEANVNFATEKLTINYDETPQIQRRAFIKGFINFW